MRKFSAHFLLISLMILPAMVWSSDQTLPTDKKSLKKLIWDTIEEFRLYEIKNGKEEETLRTIYDAGFYLKGKDDTLKIGGWYQGDLNVFNHGNEGNTRFRNRRARLDIRGVLEDYFEYRLFPQFAGTSANLQEAWLQYKYFSNFRLRLGQFKTPYSLESQYSSLWTDFVEKSVGVANIDPAPEDIGFMIFGNPFQNRVEYAIGAMNGRARILEDNNDSFDGAARIIFAPFITSENQTWKEIYVGGSFTIGRSKETLAATGFSTAGGNLFATYGSATRHAAERRRYGAELQWIFGPGDIKAEYVGARFDDVDRSNVKEDVNIDAWYVSFDYILTGERKVKDRWITPKEKFSWKEGGAGAWEIAFRVEQFFINDNPFQSGILTGSNSVKAATAALNWWPNRHTRLMLNGEYTYLDERVFIGSEAENDELLFLLRAQYTF